MSALDWVIVGGGPHGVCAARALIDAGAQVRIVEPSGALLHRWSQRARSVAMTWMRSPVAHHLGAHPVDFDHFLHRPDNADVAQLAGPLRRPKHDAFVRHSRHVIERAQLQETVVAGRVESVRHAGDGIIVTGPDVELTTRRVLLATGSNRPRIPDWATALRTKGAHIRHVFEASEMPARDIVGGGISAVQHALEVRRQTNRLVRLWMRRPVRVADFDYEQEWTTARFLSWWSRLDADRRLAFNKREEPTGSVPMGLSRRLRKAVRNGQIEVRHEIPDVSLSPTGGHLVLRGSSGSFEAPAVTLATGLAAERVDGWLQTCAQELGLPMKDGVPVLRDDMHWGCNVYVSGPLARLRLGPMATNLIGARWAASLLPGIRMQPR